jgi:hypothetical protein
VQSPTSDTHRFDKWMVKFLQEYGKTLDEKERNQNPTIVTIPPELYNSGLGQRGRTIQDIMLTFLNVD